MIAVPKSGNGSWITEVAGYVNFQRLILDVVEQSFVDVQSELASHEEAWLVHQGRQNRVRVQQHTQSIPLRAGVPDAEGRTIIEDIHLSRCTALSQHFPVTLSVLASIASELEGVLGRVMFVRLLPGHVVYPHIDGGAYYTIRDRYHLVLESALGSPMRCESEEVVMREGELWRFDNKRMHDSRNDSEMWRTHLIFDLQPQPRRASVIGLCA